MNKLPEMLLGEDLKDALAVFPEYSEEIQGAPASTRLLRLSDIYGLYVPSTMATEIYSRIYLSTVLSFGKKGTIDAVKQYNENYRAVHNATSAHGIIGGSSSFTILGPSGIGKSSAVERAVSLIDRNEVMERESPYAKIIPCLMVQCPFDCSAKGLLLEILRKVDERLGSEYFKSVVKVRSTVDILIGTVSQIALNHIGLLIVDEIQNVVRSKNGGSLVGILTQLINSSGISICMVGIPESADFFESEMYLARRALGLRYDTMSYTDFQNFCEVLFRYQYVKNQTEQTEALTAWLYEHSAGIVSVAVGLFHDAQEMAILSGKESLGLETLEEAYRNRMGLLHKHISDSNALHGKVKALSRNNSRNTTHASAIHTAGQSDAQSASQSITALAEKGKKEGMDMVGLLKKYYTVEVVAV